MRRTYSIFFKNICLMLMLQLPARAQTYQLVWSDEFNGSIGPDWVFETGAGGWGNNELQYYRQQNATIQNNALVITARREAFGGMNYTSARMKTQGRKSWKYGKIEARMSMPSFLGIWPAFWMLGDNISSVGWPACGEIDIMEHVNTGGEVRGTIHWSDQNNIYAQYGGGTTTSITAMHTYTIEWTPASIKWFVDGAQFHEVNIANGINGTSEFQNNFFILFNLAVGGNWPGFTIDNNGFPASIVVDYVRVYQLSGQPPAPTFTRTIQAESYNAMLGVQLENTTDAGGGQNVGWINNSDWMAYNAINIPTSGAYRVEYRVASTTATGRLSLDLNAGSIQLGALNVPNTGGWQTWTTISHTVNITAGTYNFGIFAQAGGWNINWWRITRIGAEARTAGELTENLETFTSSAYPNAFTNSTKIKVILPEGGLTNVTIYNAIGTKIINLHDGYLDAGIYEFDFTAGHLPAGIYIYSVSHKGKRITEKIIKN